MCRVHVKEITQRTERDFPEHHKSQTDEEEGRQENWIQTRALSNEFEKASRNNPWAWAQIQTYRQKLTTSRLKCLQRMDIQRKLGWGSAEGCIAPSAHQKKPRPRSVKSWRKLSAHPKRTAMNSRRPARERKRNWVKLSAQFFLPSKNWDEYQGTSEMATQTFGWRELKTSEEFQVLRLSSPCYFWNNDFSGWEFEQSWDW